MAKTKSTTEEFTAADTGPVEQPVAAEPATPPKWGSIGEDKVTRAAEDAYKAHGSVILAKHNKPFDDWANLSADDREPWLNAAYSFLRGGS